MVGSLIFNDMLIIQQNNTIIYIVKFLFISSKQRTLEVGVRGNEAQRVWESVSDVDE